MKVIAKINFNDIEADVHREANKSVWECSEERAKFLLEHNAIEILEEEKKEVEEIINVEEKPKKQTRTKKK